MESEGQPTIFPVLRYKDARASIDWLVQAFGFERHAEHAGPDGTIAHAEVGLGAGLLAISSLTPPTDANPWSSVRQGIYMVVTDPDGHHARAKNAGAEIALPLTDMDYGSRDYAARDLDGNLWGFGTYNMGGRRGDVTLVPELRCHDAPAAVAFFTRAFGFESTFQVPGPNGSLVHAELRFGEGALYVGPLSHGEWADLKQFVNVVVDDPDRHHARAKAAGASIVMGPKDTPFGARFYSARDPEGFLWWLSTYKPAKKQN